MNTKVFTKLIPKLITKYPRINSATYIIGKKISFPFNTTMYKIIFPLNATSYKPQYSTRKPRNCGDN